jgi:NAD(P)-dependent dehydrogenase (short-subunit alcohol dehydrogenase family)
MRAVWNTNVFGVLSVYQAMLPLLRATPGARIVNVSSGVGSLTATSDPAYPYRAIFGPVYPASKTALNALTVAMALELEPEGIKVNAVSRGYTQNESQWLFRHGDGRGGRPRSCARCIARSGRPDWQVHALEKRKYPLVMHAQRPSKSAINSSMPRRRVAVSGHSGYRDHASVSILAPGQRVLDAI